MEHDHGSYIINIIDDMADSTRL